MGFLEIFRFDPVIGGFPIDPPCFVDHKLPKNLAVYLAAQGERLDVPHLFGRRGSWCFRFTPLPLGPALEVVGSALAGVCFVYLKGMVRDF
jgi:hypothetical protein